MCFVRIVLHIKTTIINIWNYIYKNIVYHNVYKAPKHWYFSVYKLHTNTSKNNVIDVVTQ